MQEVMVALGAICARRTCNRVLFVTRTLITAIATDGRRRMATTICPE